MHETRDRIKYHIIATIDHLRTFTVDEAADLISEVADEIAGDRTDDMINGAILDGIRWGYAAAVTVELGGAAMLRVLTPGGVAITHEWGNADEADTQIKAALAAIQTSRANDDQSR